MTTTIDTQDGPVLDWCYDIDGLIEAVGKAVEVL